MFNTRNGIRSAHFTDMLKKETPTKRNKRRFKFDLEAMSSSLVQMWRGDVLDLQSEVDLADLDEDLLKIKSKGLTNMMTFVLEYIAGDF